MSHSPARDVPTAPERHGCVLEHDGRLQGLVRTAKGQVDYYQCQRCLAPRHDRHPTRVREDRS